MSNPQVPLNQQVFDKIQGFDANGNVQALGSLTLTIDDYVTAFVAADPGGNNGNAKGFLVTPKNLALVGTKTVTITAHATDLAGNQLPPATIQFDIVGATPPPLAQTLSFGNAQVGNFPAEPDPGSPTATLI